MLSRYAWKPGDAGVEALVPGLQVLGNHDRALIRGGLLEQLLIHVPLLNLLLLQPAPALLQQQIQQQMQPVQEQVQLHQQQVC